MHVSSQTSPPTSDPPPAGAMGDPGAPTDEPLLVVENLCVQFGTLTAVDNVEFNLHAGDLLGLIGPNGAGKTTLLRAAAGLQPATVGRVTVFGRDVLDDDRTVRAHIGFAPDSPPIYEELTVETFLTFIALCYKLDTETAQERIDFWLEQLWLTDKRKEKIRNLSHGMRQRVTIARTLVPNPSVILLDEPSGGLDPAGRIQFRKVLASLRDQGKALIVSSHILADLEEYCTHIAIIERGRLLRAGRVSDLHDRRAGRRHYRLTVVSASDDFPAKLGAMDGVSDVARVDGAWMLEYDDDRDRAADLLKRLIAADVPVDSFAPRDESLEDVYLKAGVRQVD